MHENHPLSHVCPRRACAAKTERNCQTPDGEACDPHPERILRAFDGAQETTGAALRFEGRNLCPKCWRDLGPAEPFFNFGLLAAPCPMCGLYARLPTEAN